MKINILGQDYQIKKLSGKQYPKLDLADADGMAELYSKTLVIHKGIMGESDGLEFDNMQGYENQVMRHEIVHAYFHEAGLMHYCYDEKLVDWIALQLPKMTKSMEKLGCL